MTLGLPGTPKNVDELTLLLWENPPICPCLSIPGNVPGGMAPNTGICGDGEKGPTSPVGCHLSHTQGWGYNPGPPSPSLLEHQAQRGGVCLCVSLAKHFRVPQTRCPRWGPHLAPVDLVSPTHAVTTLERSPWLAQGNVPERSVCALVRVDLDTAWS